MHSIPHSNSAARGLWDVPGTEAHLLVWLIDGSARLRSSVARQARQAGS